MSYRAPIADYRLIMEAILPLDRLASTDHFAEATPETVQAVLSEAARLAEAVLAPLNPAGDATPARLENGTLRSSPGFAEGFAALAAGGWVGLAADPEHGGMGLPQMVNQAVAEMFAGANLALQLNPLLTQGQIEALQHHADPDMQALYLPRLISGEWSGTMNLTEPQAGSDVGALRAKAEPRGDGTYAVTGQKIFITWGEHDMTENIVHLVLARLPDAPEGVKGISLFVVPKFLVNADGSLGARNDVRCGSLEHKLGIHASPTAVLNFGEKDGAIGYLVGEANRGLEYMFIMMNEARYAVGVQGIAIGERAYQQAAAYAHERRQGRDLTDPRGPTAPIARHPDVRRMLLTMRAITEANRALSMTLAALLDHGHAGNRDAQALAEFLVPIHKGWATEAANEVTSLGVQVHGGMGFIEETGAAQHLRDARITAIYEGTTAIQANDLVGRKTARDGGAVARALAGQIRTTLAALAEADDPDLKAIHARLDAALTDFELCATYVATHFTHDIVAVHAGSVPYLTLSGLVCGGWQMARAAQAARRRLDAAQGDAGFNTAKLKTARFYADHLLTRVAGLREQVLAGASAIAEFPEERF